MKLPSATLALVALLAPVLMIWALVALQRVRRLLRDVERHLSSQEQPHQDG